MQQNVGADSLYVRAKLSAPIPTVPAVILAPDSGFVTTTGLVTISGTCPSATPPNIVVILEDSTSIASTPCQPSDTFSVDVTLQAGTHVLEAQIFNITEDPGPSSSPITGTYTPPVPPKPAEPTIPTPQPPVTPPNSSTASPTPTPAPTNTTALNITTNRSFFTYGPNSPVTWTGTLSGGTPPYSITFTWGDGTSNTYTVLDTDTHQFSHFYQTIGLYYITVTIEDAVGNSFTNTYAAVSPYIPRDDQTDTEEPSGLLFTAPPTDNTTKIALFSIYTLTTAVVVLIWFNAHTTHHLRPALQHSYNKPKSTQRTSKGQASRANSNKRSARSSTRKR